MKRNALGRSRSTLAEAPGFDLDALVREGLRAPQKRLPAALFYDAVGSALFDEITRTPEYYPTRTELSILQRHAEEILQAARPPTGPLVVVELGAGSAEKTRVLLRRLAAMQGGGCYVPIDISAEPIHRAALEIQEEIAGLEVLPLVGDHDPALARLPADGPARLILFIGSSIGNYEPEEAAGFLARVGARMRPEDRMLLGTDLVKDPAILHAAYNDAAGVTAEFNLNALARLGREYGADFDLAAFQHRAFYDPAKRRVEMHLVSLREQTARIPRLHLDVPLAKGETIHTENSYKYTQEDVDALAREGGFFVERRWTDARGWFAVHLLRGAP